MKRQEPRPDIEPASTAAMGDRIRPGTGRRVQILAGVAALTLLMKLVLPSALTPDTLSVNIALEAIWVVLP